MKKVELLAPAGSMEALQAAVQNGCDAVYLGGSMFGARAFAHNFDEQEMIEALRYAHGFGVKVYVTMNTLIYENEMAQAITYARFLYEHGVDALILQDLGLFDVLHQMFPELELHASTQMHVHNLEGISFLKEAGMRRIVLPRETTIEEIREYTRQGIDTEVFVQGALCVSYSGQCLMSAKELQRSGNRGACAQMCRMKYRLGYEQQGMTAYVKQAGEYILSPKDLNTLHRVPELIEAGISSFKIEGRMKRPAYVAQMVSLYRKAIDAYLEQRPFYEPDADADMRKIFNREFSEGHMFKCRGSALMNPLRPNHMGIPIGTVLGKQGRRVTIKLTHPLVQHDGIRFLCDGEDIGCMVNKLYVKGYLQNQANAQEIVEVEVDGRIPKQTVVVKTSDSIQLKALQETYQQPNRKVMIQMFVEGRLNEALRLEVVDESNNRVVVKSDCLIERALKTPLEEQRLRKQLIKCGDTVFQVARLDVQIDDQIILPIKAVNELRRTALQALYERRVTPKPIIEKTYHRELTIKQSAQIYAAVHHIEQYEACQGIENLKLFAYDPLYRTLHQQPCRIGYAGKRVMKQPYPSNDILCAEIGILQHLKTVHNYDVIADHFLNVTNSYAAAFLFAHGITGIVLSNECSKEQVQQIKAAFHERYGTEGNFLPDLYGREELMVMEYCPINFCEKDNDKRSCSLCKGNRSYFLEDIHGTRYPLYGDEDCRMHILDHTCERKEAQGCGLYTFSTETKKGTEAIVKSIPCISS